jgi:hypothetical protein
VTLSEEGEKRRRRGITLAAARVSAGMPHGGTGVVYTAGRIQPYAIWEHSYIVRYCVTEAAAQRVVREHGS